jgi:short-subunit dehydrogenase
MFEFQDRLALITGASRGIGERLAFACAEKGMRLLLTARSETALEGIADRLRANKVEVHAVAVDIAQGSSREKLIQVAEDLGGVHLLVNNAGVEQHAMYETVGVSEIEYVLNVNLLAPMHLARLALIGMQRRRSGHILNMASLSGLFGLAHSEAYTAAKHGLVGFTRSLRASAQEEQTGLSASVVCSGFVDDVGMYVRMQQEYGAKASNFYPAVHSRDVVKAALRAVERDLPDALVTVGPIRFGLALNTLAPRFGEFVARETGSNKVAVKVARGRLSRGPGQPPR